MRGFLLRTVKGYLPLVGKPFKMRGYDLGKSFSPRYCRSPLSTLKLQPIVPLPSPATSVAIPPTGVTPWMP